MKSRMASGLSHIEEWEKQIRDLLMPDKTAPSAEWLVECHEEVTSTMDQARAALSCAAENRPILVLARSQTAGRGRQGRSWHSTRGAFYGTFVFCSGRARTALAAFSLVAGCALVDVIDCFGGAVGLKWPNDVLSLRRKKVGGVLLEAAAHGDKTCVLVGVGINLACASVSVPQSTSLLDVCGKLITAPQMAGALGPVLLEAWRTFVQQGFGPFRARWERSALYLGEPVSYETGCEVIKGVALGVDERGNLMLKSGNQVRAVVSGHMLNGERGVEIC